MTEERKQTVPVVLYRFARLMGTEVRNRRIDIPAAFGTGYCTGFVFNDFIRMMILNYELKEDLLIENPDVNAVASMILFKFQHIIPERDKLVPQKQKAAPSVLVATRNVNTGTIMPIHTATATINIEIDANYLDGLFGTTGKSPVLQSLLQNTQPLLFEQIVRPSLQKIVDEIMSEPVDEPFELFFMRVKAEELVCKLLIELEKRNEKHLYALNIKDIESIYKVKEQMLAKLDTAPVIRDLALSAGMSPTKLKRLFRQIFGNSIFSYYQEFRMEEAALLLKAGRLSVSDVGYRLGFTNLSHFSRIFKEHTGMNPKQYSRS